MFARQDDLKDFHPWEIIISDINGILRELHIVISASFLSNKAGMVAQHEHAVFEEIWAQLNCYQLDQLDEHYQQLENSVEYIVQKYCEKVNIPRQTILPTTMTFYARI